MCIVTEQRILKLDESPSQIRNPKSQVELEWPRTASSRGATELVRFEVSDFGFGMGFRPISNFRCDRSLVAAASRFWPTIALR